jgi:hypothetical protein
MVPVFTMSDEKFAACAGYDALTYVNFLKLCLRITFLITVIVGVLVLPTNWAGGSFIQHQLGLQDRVEKLLHEINPKWSVADQCDRSKDTAAGSVPGATVCMHFLVQQSVFIPFLDSLCH